MFAKKVIALLLSLLLMAACIPSALAADISANGTADNKVLQKEQLPIITPKYSYTSSVNASLSFSGNTAYCKGSVMPGGLYNVSLTVTLYKKNGSQWNYVASWSGSSTGGSKASASGSTSITSGTYMVKTRGDIGGGLEYPSTSVTKTK